ncbi:hypothetical protein A0H81_05470 [Grifola frondosa]|uniref:Uncharacterized protein n=1 Tax=Grifola frondosa TaxID=5627 RepID=A0A1C7MEY0_GRIFR|nr:hypothetical protein A0H81_05470 [Grifola frondosa]
MPMQTPPEVTTPAVNTNDGDHTPIDVLTDDAPPMHTGDAGQDTTAPLHVQPAATVDTPAMPLPVTAPIAATLTTDTAVPTPAMPLPVTPPMAATPVQLTVPVPVPTGTAAAPLPVPNTVVAIAPVAAPAVPVPVVNAAGGTLPVGMLLAGAGAAPMPQPLVTPPVGNIIVPQGAAAAAIAPALPLAVPMPLAPAGAALQGVPIINGAVHDPALSARLQVFQELEDHTTHRYGVAKVPVKAGWGATFIKQRVLCINETPLTVGHHRTKGDAVPRVSIGVRPCSEGDIAAAQKLLGGRAGPPYEHSNTTIYVRKDQTCREHGKNKATPKPFENVFNATVDGAPPTRVDANTIVNGDIVVVECQLRRWQKVGNENNKNWEEWGTQLQLVRIDLLYAQPDHDD